MTEHSKEFVGIWSILLTVNFSIYVIFNAILSLILTYVCIGFVVWNILELIEEWKK